jgi:hypothetical protein
MGVFARARYALPLLAGGLLLLLAVFWLVPGPSAVSGRVPAAISAAAPDVTDAAIGQWGGTVLARPLFTPGRRPADQAGGNADGSLPRLSAIILSGGAGMAVFAADGRKPQVVGTGGVIGGYVLVRVTADHIELTGPAGALTLRPRFAASDAQAGSAPAPPVVVSTPAQQLQEFPPMPGQTQPAFNPSSNPAMMIEQNY